MPFHDVYLALTTDIDSDLEETQVQEQFIDRPMFLEELMVKTDYPNCDKAVKIYRVRVQRLLPTQQVLHLSSHFGCTAVIWSPLARQRFAANNGREGLAAAILNDLQRMHPDY